MNEISLYHVVTHITIQRIKDKVNRIDGKFKGWPKRNTKVDMQKYPLKLIDFF